MKNSARYLLLVLAGFLAQSAPAFSQAQAPAPTKAVQEISGTSPQVTEPFNVADAWVVRWAAPRPVNLSVLAADGSLVSGAAGSRGALYVAKGGTYKLQIDCGATPGAPPATSPVTGNNPGQPQRPISMLNRPYEIQVVQLSTAMDTPSRTAWVMPNYNPPGKGIANLSGPNGATTFAPPVIFTRSVQPSSPAPAPFPMNRSSAPNTPDSSAPPPDAGG